jgi:hypothetical protein
MLKNAEDTGYPHALSTKLCPEEPIKMLQRRARYSPIGWFGVLYVQHVRWSNL